jgi:hypothetical protein
MKLIQKYTYSLVYLLVILFIGLSMHQEVYGKEFPQAKIIENEGKYGLIGRDNEVVLETIYYEIKQVQQSGALHLYSVKQKDGKCALVYEIYTNSSTISWHKTDFIYDYVSEIFFYQVYTYNSGFIAIIVAQEGLQGILTLDYKRSSADFVIDYFIRSELKPKIDFKYQNITGEREASEYLLTTNEKGLIGMINMLTGKEYPPKYDKIEIPFGLEVPRANEKENSAYKKVTLNNKQGRVYLASDGYREIIAPLFSEIRDLVTDTLFYALQNDTIYIYDAVKKKTYTPKYNNKNLTYKEKGYTRLHYIPYSDNIVIQLDEKKIPEKQQVSEIYIYNLKKDSIVRVYKNDADLLSFYFWIHSGSIKICPDGLIINNVYDSIKKRYTVEIINVSNQNLSYKFTSKYHSFPNYDAYYNKNDKSLLTVIEVYHPKKGYQPIGYYSITTGEFTKRIKDKNAYKNEKGEYRYNYKFYLKDL